MKRLILSLMTVISFVLQPAVGYAASLPGMSYPYSASTIYNLARSSNSYKLTSLSKRDMDVTNQYGDTALCLAVRNHDKEAYNVLLEAGANPNPQCMNALESMRPIKSGLSSIFTPKLGYLFGLVAVGGGVALASGGGGGSKTCPGYTKADCPEAYHIEGVCEENIAYHKCSANKNNTTENCEVFVLNKDECITCKWNYYREGTDCKEREITENCEVFDDTEDACLICKNGYYLSYGACLKGDIDNCYVYESKEVCSTCEEGYVVTVNRDACVLPIEHCNTYGIDKSKGREVCMTCDTGYFPSKDGSTCVPKIEYCLIYENDGSCQECMPNYAVTEDKDKCVPYIDRCQEYNEDGTCKACETGYVYGEDAFHCVRQMDGCKEYSNDGKCTKCDATGDWSHLYEGKCYKAYQYCQEKSYGTPTCSASQYKNFCKLPDETGAETGIENKNYWLCEDGPENCKKTDQDTGLCEECNSGWYVDGGVCYQQEITGCQEYVPNEDKCETCENKYYLNEQAKCSLITVNNCEQNNTNENTCYQCSSSFYPDNEGTDCAKITHCTASDGYDNSCTQCEDDYYLKDGVCIAKIDSCKEYNSDGTCEECESLYYINNDGATCSKIDSYDTCKGSDGKNNKCTTCNANYYPDTSGMCQEQSVANCDTYVENENKCEVCDNNGYKVNSSGQCEEIAKCNISNGKDACTTCDGDNAWYVNDDGTCSQNNECATTDGKEATCTSCATDYYLDGGHCYGEQEYCDRQDNHGRDVKTNPCEAYQIAEMCQLSDTQQSEKYGKCVTGSVIAHCEVRDTDPLSPTVGKCTQCQTSGSDGAYIIADQGAACQKIDNCTESDGTDECTTCDGDNAYYVEGGSCTQKARCSKTDGINPTCTECQSAYPQPREGSCYTEQEYCSLTGYAHTGSCSTPSTQYPEFCELAVYQVTPLSTTYNNCVDGEITGCIQYDQSWNHPNECTQCASGYYLDGTTCVTQPTQFGCKTYKTEAEGCETCYDGFEKKDGTCVRNEDYVAAENYHYRVSNYTDSSLEPVTPVVKVVEKNSEDPKITVIGFTAATGEGVTNYASDAGHSSDPGLGKNFYYDYDVYNTSYAAGYSETSGADIVLDGDSIKIDETKINAIEKNGKLIGLSSPGFVNEHGQWSYKGNSSVYNAASFGEYVTRTGTITITYAPVVSADYSGLTVYGIEAKNYAYNAYANAGEAEANGSISITSSNATFNYGIRAGKDAYNAYGHGATGEIVFQSTNTDAKFIGISSLVNAYNAANSGVGTIFASNTDSSNMDNEFVGMQVTNESAYNAYVQEGYCSMGTITLLSADSTAMQATEGGTLYNAYGNNPSTANSATGIINLPYGGVAFKTSGVAYNAYNGSGTVSIGEDLENSSDRYTICDGCAYFYNSYGAGSRGEINIYGNIDTIADFVNSYEGGKGTVNIYTYAPNSGLTDNTLNVISYAENSSNSSNGNNGHINIVLGSGWDNYDYSINPLNGVALTGDSTITITNKQVNIDAHNAFVKEIVGVKDSYMSDSGASPDGAGASITIATDWPNDGVYDVSEPLTEILEAHHIYGIQNPTQDITGGTINIQARLFSDNDSEEAGYAYGIYDGDHSVDTVYTNNAKVNMQILGAENYLLTMNETTYGLYNVNNGENGAIYLDSFLYINPDTDIMQCTGDLIGMYGDKGDMQNEGTIAIGTNHRTGEELKNHNTDSGYVNRRIVGMHGSQYSEVENITNSGNIIINSPWYREVRGIFADDINESGNITNTGSITLSVGGRQEDKTSEHRYYEVYGIVSESDVNQPKATNISNSGKIDILSVQDDEENIIRGNIYGIDSGPGINNSTRASATNTGEINIKTEQESRFDDDDGSGQNIYGMIGTVYVELYNGTDDDSENAKINITTTAAVHEIIGMQATGASAGSTDCQNDPTACQSMAKNYGDIKINAQGKANSTDDIKDIVYGMYGFINSQAYNSGNIEITVDNPTGNVIGMVAKQNSRAENTSEINIDVKDPTGDVFGMYADDHSTAENDHGNITITVQDPTGNVFGMYANNYSTVTNTNGGHITVKLLGRDPTYDNARAGGLMATNHSSLSNHEGSEIKIIQSDEGSYTTDSEFEDTSPAGGKLYYGYTDEAGNVSPTVAAIVIDDTSEIINEGTITSQAAVNITGGGRMLMSRGAKLVAPSVTGALTLASDIVTEGNEDVYTTTNLVTGNSDDVTVESASAMFTASTVVNADDDNSIDGVLTRKSFDTMVQSAALANYLEDNYTGDNAQEFFATLKTASSASEFDEILSKELGLCLMPNFAQENFNVFRSLGNLITDNLFSKEMTDERMMVGYDYLALSRDTKKKVTGYENTSNSSYFLGDIKLDKRSRFGLGLSITKFNSDYDDDSDRDEMFAQLLASYMYDFGNKWRYAGVLHSGYGWGDYTRKLNHGDVDGNLHDFIYGLQNEFRYGIETPYVTLEPQVEMNFTGYYQRRINEEHKNGSIIMKGTNNFSAESGIGLYASKEFNLEKYGKFKGRVGGSYYHEWAHPYGSIKSRMRGTDGWYKIESDDIFERDRFMISADVTYTYKMFDLYVRGSQYFEKDTVAVFNAGLKYNF